MLELNFALAAAGKHTHEHDDKDNAERKVDEGNSLSEPVSNYIYSVCTFEIMTDTVRMIQKPQEDKHEEVKPMMQRTHDIGSEDKP